MSLRQPNTFTLELTEDEIAMVHAWARDRVMGQQEHITRVLQKHAADRPDLLEAGQRNLANKESILRKVLEAQGL